MTWTRFPVHTDFKHPMAWLKEYWITENIVCDPDGWDRKNFKQSWNQRITKMEFAKRLSYSTVFLGEGMFNKLKPLYAEYFTCLRESNTV
jgi:hypothetical protein